MVANLKIFEVLHTNSAPMKCPFLGLFRPLHPQIWSDFVAIFTRNSTLADKNSLNNLSKIYFFADMRKNQSLLFCFNFDPCFPMQMAKIEERQSREKNPSPIQICQSPGPFSYPLKMKNKITFLQFMAFLDKKTECGSRLKGQNQNLTAFHCAINCGLLKTQKVWSPKFLLL